MLVTADDCVLNKDNRPLSELIVDPASLDVSLENQMGLTADIVLCSMPIAGG